MCIDLFQQLINHYVDPSASLGHKRGLQPSQRAFQCTGCTPELIHAMLCELICFRVKPYGLIRRLQEDENAKSKP